DEDMEAIRARQPEIAERVAGREGEIGHLLQAPEATDVQIIPASEPVGDPEGEQVLDQIRRSVADEAVSAQLEGASGGPRPPATGAPQDSGMPPRTEAQPPPPPPQGFAPEPQPRPDGPPEDGPQPGATPYDGGQQDQMRNEGEHRG
ncbi:MAG TPA: hypothetical protein VK045_05215, partial [Ornithinicoccus sp.]|nr:hypothetical protein [Ornithinicoccus sp.]